MAETGNRNFDIVLSHRNGSPRILACEAPEFSFHFPHMAGNFRLGVTRGGESLWIDELKSITVEKKDGRLSYICNDPLLGKGIIVVRVAALSDSDGMVMEIEAAQIDSGTTLIWAFGGCLGEVLEDVAQSRIYPAYCNYNVFSVEGAAFSAYYGESMNLKIIQGVTPPDSEIRLSDAHSQQSPLALFGSGKRTDAPVLSGMVPVESGTRLYFCIYTQNGKADYNYYMLPSLFDREFAS